MADDRLPIHPDQGGRHLTPRQSQAGPAAPLHDPRELRFGGSVGTREELWEQLSEPVRQRVRERAGETIEWWAARYGDRVSAVVFGTRALIVLEPTVNAAGRPATEVSTVVLDEASFRSARVTGESTPAGPAGPAGTPIAQARAPQQPPPPRQQSHQQLPSQSPQQHQLSADMSGFLGQLPPRAQQLLQDPFAAPAGRLRYDFYYYMAHRGHGFGGGTLHVWCYLADNRTATFCAGVGHGYRDGGGAASWELTCWRAAVAAKPRA